MKKRISIVFALTLAFLLVMTSAAMAETELPDGVNGKVISNELEGTFEVTGEAPSGEVYVNDEEGLRDALANSDVNTIIIIESNIENIGERLVVNRPVTINGNNKTLSFTKALNNGANGERNGLLVTADDVTIENLNIEMSGEPGWQGVYGIQVYNATDVTIEDYTGSGGDAALLINGAKVTLSGKIDVSDNEFGGIEVSPGVNVTSDTHLNLNGATLINKSEAFGCPTIWEDDVKDDEANRVTGFNEEPITLTAPNDKLQKHYYLDEKNQYAIYLSWGEGTVYKVESPFEVTVTAENRTKDAIDKVLYIIEVTDAQGIKRAVDIEGEEELGYNENGGFWYWEPSNGFNFSAGAEFTTTFKVTADPGTYDVKIYAVQLEK